ncbi:MAG: hypothetical protein LBN92_06915, partial [Treponema sp.]|nr:hypothetical protein [Treponema sp.]
GAGYIVKFFAMHAIASSLSLRMNEEPPRTPGRTKEGGMLEHIRNFTRFGRVFLVSARAEHVVRG